MVVIDRETERLATRLFMDFSPQPDFGVEPFQPHYTNDAVDGQPVTDCLSVEDQADNFARLLTSKNVTLPLAIGLFGNWGSGKSFFMKLIRQRMEYITAREVRLSTGVYCTNVAHITFNAWHYLDSNLWPSLALRIFEGVAAYLGGNKPEDPLNTETAKKKRELAEVIESSQRARIEADHAIKAAQDDRRVCEARIAALRNERTAKLQFLTEKGFAAAAGDIKCAIGFLGIAKVEDLDGLERAVQEGRTIIGQLAPIFTGLFPRVPLYGRIALVAAIGVLVDVLPKALPISPVAGWVGGLTAAAGWAVHRMGEGRKALAALMDAAKRVRAAADASAAAASEELREIDTQIEAHRLRIAAADNEIAAAEVRLQQIKSGALVYEFLKERLAARNYIEGIGIISVLRQDLERLKQRLQELNQEGDGAKVERIILYIDDLDRCDPERVVEVLQAVHLLLAFDLFAVVVAVDPRWLERSLYKRYLPGFEEMTEDQRITSEFSPQNYLEKIFQIPYRVPSMNAGTFGKLVDNLRPIPVRSLPPIDSGANKLKEEEEAAEARAETVESSLIEISRDRVSKPPPLELEDHEIDAIKAVAPLIGTPRAAKRLMNVYALIRMRVSGDELRELAQSIDGCKPLILLLALDIGFPRVAQLVRHELLNPAGILVPMIDDLASKCGNQHHELHRQFQRLVGILSEMGPVKCEAMTRWLPYVEDYSFHSAEGIDALGTVMPKVVSS